jgi:hypothetical protein
LLLIYSCIICERKTNALLLLTWGPSWRHYLGKPGRNPVFKYSRVLSNQELKETTMHLLQF